MDLDRRPSPGGITHRLLCISKPVAIRALAFFAFCSIVWGDEGGNELGRGVTPKPGPQASVEIAGQKVTIVAPVLGGGEDPDEIERLLGPLLRGLSYRQFTRDSVVAPVRMQLRYLKDEAGDPVGHHGHILFVVHESLDSFSSDRFTESVFAETAKETPADEHTAGTMSVGKATLQELGIESDDDTSNYRRVRFDLLDQVTLDLMVRFDHSSTESQNRIDIALVEQYDNRWQRVDDPDEGGSYRGLHAWITATSLTGSDAVLIESRFVFLEPSNWFRGNNYVRSKLPLVLQEAARDLRRELKKKRPSD